MDRHPQISTYVQLQPSKEVKEKLVTSQRADQSAPSACLGLNMETWRMEAPNTARDLAGPGVSLLPHGNR